MPTIKIKENVLFPKADKICKNMYFKCLNLYYYVVIYNMFLTWSAINPEYTYNYATLITSEP